jgi:hypothetical protein
MSHRKAFIEAVDIVTVEPDATGIHVVGASNKNLSEKIDGQHFDDETIAVAEISEIAGHPVRLRRAAQHQPSTAPA